MNNRIKLAKIGAILSICIACLGWLYADYDYGSVRTARECMPNHRWYSLKGCIEAHQLLVLEGVTTERYRRMVGYWESDRQQAIALGRYDYPDRPPVEWERVPIWIQYRTILAFCIMLLSGSLAMLFTSRHDGREHSPDAPTVDEQAKPRHIHISSRMKAATIRNIVVLQVATRDGLGSVVGMLRELGGNIAVIFMLLLFTVPLLLMFYFFVFPGHA